MAKLISDEALLPDRERALFGPRNLKPKGSPEWCWQTVHLLQRHWERISDDERQFEETLSELKEVRAWEKVPPGRPYGSLDALLDAEIGKGETAVTERIKRIRELREQEVGKGKAGPGRGHKTGSITTRFGRDNEYLTARIARDRPDILARMKAGEFKSVRAAAKEAGIVKERISLLKEPHAAAATLKRHFTAAEIAEIVRLLHWEKE